MNEDNIRTSVKRKREDTDRIINTGGLAQLLGISQHDYLLIKKNIHENPENTFKLIDENDIEIVMSQAGVNRTIAIKALIKHKNDIVNAIMDLTIVQ